MPGWCLVLIGFTDLGSWGWWTWEHGGGGGGGYVGRGLVCFLRLQALINMAYIVKCVIIILLVVWGDRE